VPIGAGPGEIEVPWTGDPGEVVLLDVSLRRGNAWAGFTYSPWFLDIPHEDLHFETDQAEILSSEVWKLQATLEQLGSVLEKYGSVVPVKLYIAGCTDTVGNPSHNLDLSRRRARAIATWLRANGYDRPIYYHGFGEGFLAVPTGDEVDEGANRRALYLVGANPPPAGSGVPAVSWTAL
jgi:outer membrane protein OmpA-like peptidoglycan-associated protein